MVLTDIQIKTLKDKLLNAVLETVVRPEEIARYRQLKASENKYKSKTQRFTNIIKSYTHEHGHIPSNILINVAVDLGKLVADYNACFQERCKLEKDIMDRFSRDAICDFFEKLRGRDISTAQFNQDLDALILELKLNEKCGNKSDPINQAVSEIKKLAAKGIKQSFFSQFKNYLSRKKSSSTELSDSTLVNSNKQKNKSTSRPIAALIKYITAQRCESKNRDVCFGEESRTVGTHSSRTNNQTEQHEQYEPRFSKN